MATPATRILGRTGLPCSRHQYIQQTPQWSNTVIILTYDDSDGWYDHVHNVVNGSATPKDAFSGPGNVAMNDRTAGRRTEHFACPGPMQLWPTPAATGHLSWAKPNYVSHTSPIRPPSCASSKTLLNQQRIGQGSYDAIAGSLSDMLDFSETAPQNGAVVLLDDDRPVTSH